MKDIMAKRGAVDGDGVPLFEYVPSSVGKQFALESDRPLGTLRADLLRKFAGQELTVRQVYELHNVGTPFVMPNYKRVLKQMEEDGEIRCRPDRVSRRGDSLAGAVSISFPPAAAA
jgi:hypothetical protein